MATFLSFSLSSFLSQFKRRKHHPPTTWLTHRDTSNQPTALIVTACHTSGFSGVLLLHQNDPYEPRTTSGRRPPVIKKKKTSIIFMQTEHDNKSTMKTNIKLLSLSLSFSPKSQHVTLAISHCPLFLSFIPVFHFHFPFPTCDFLSFRFAFALFWCA